MCGFLSVFSPNKDILNHVESNVSELMKLIEKRGPNKTNNTRDENYFISHALLAINDFVPQPVSNEKLVVFMNGEIYNEDALLAKNDTEWLLSFFEKQRDVSDLDGEFIIFCHNKEENTLEIISDPFATKPCYYAMGSDFFIAASYYEPIASLINDDSKGLVEFPPNQYVKIDLNKMTVISYKEVVQWDFNPRYDNFDKWNESFSKSIKKRSHTDKGIFLGLSSGYDSGLIVSELINLEKPFTSYSIIGAENEETLNKRIELVKQSKSGTANTVLYDQERYDRHLAYIKENSANYPYRDVFGRFIKWMLDDKAAVGLSMICEDAKDIDAIIYFSGQGADEIFSDYKTRGPHHGTIRGNFKNVRSKWTNFDKGFQRNFLSKEERVPGAWGIEARYPFLDRDVVQNFLWLNDDLKNSEYKQCIAQKLRQDNFPFDENEKRGFNPLKSLPKGKIIYGE